MSYLCAICNSVCKEQNLKEGAIFSCRRINHPDLEYRVLLGMHFVHEKILSYSKQFYFSFGRIFCDDSVYYFIRKCFLSAILTDEDEDEYERFDDFEIDFGVFKNTTKEKFELKLKNMRLMS